MGKLKPKPVADPLIEPGYSGDGLSMFTHRAAKSKQSKPSAVARPQTVRSLIEDQERKLRDLQADYRAMMTDPVKLPRIMRDIDIKEKFIARLWAELGVEIKKGRA
jgi:hypothetical protein